jgi:hypothetical protein
VSKRILIEHCAGSEQPFGIEELLDPPHQGGRLRPPLFLQECGDVPSRPVGL